MKIPATGEVADLRLLRRQQFRLLLKTSLGDAYPGTTQNGQLHVIFTGAVDIGVLVVPFKARNAVHFIRSCNLYRLAP